MISFFKSKDAMELMDSLKSVLKNNQIDINNEINEVMTNLDRRLKEYAAFKHALDQSIIVAAINVSGQIIYVNDKFCEISQYRRDELIGKTNRIVKSGHHKKEYIRQMWETILQGEIWEGNLKNKAKDGTDYWMKTTIVPLCGDDNKPYMFIALRTDISEVIKMEEQLVNALKNDFNMVVSSMHNFVYKLTRDEDGAYRYIFGEGLLARQLGLETDVIFQKTPRDVFPLSLAELLEKKYDRAYNGETVTFDYSYHGHHISTTLSPVYEEGKIVNVIASSNDITELQKTKEEVEYLAYHDALTKIPNRRKFNEDCDMLIKIGKPFALFLIDIDRFKHINDSLGHTVGDALLKRIVDKIQEAIFLSDAFYRFAGDEFIILLPGVSEIDDINWYAQQIIDACQDPIHVHDTLELHITMSIGISLFPDQGKDMDTLVNHADAAMYDAKKKGRSAYKIFDHEMAIAKQKQVQIETYLQSALKNNEFRLVYQPKLDIETNKIKSMEALLRWENPILGNVPPPTFIPIAEETGFIRQIDEWVLRNACQQNKIWNESREHSPLRIAVNISPSQFGHPDFTVMVQQVLEETGLDPYLLELEITENTIIKNTEECIKNVNQLRNIGVAISIDDFGTGYSSINYLKQFPFDYLKIDRSYIRDIETSKENKAIVKAIISLARELQLKIVAEGVENSEIISFLKELGCDEIQGYAISRPLESTDFEKLLV